MEPSAFLILTTVSAISMALPGPAIIPTFARSSSRGLSTGAGVSARLLLSSLPLATGAVLILAGLIECSESVLARARWVEFAVILWIALRLALAPGTAVAEGHGPVCAGDILSGFFVGVASPFELVFLLGVLPQVIPERMTAEGALVMVAAYLAGQFIVLAAVTILGATAGRALSGRSGARLLQRMAGVRLAGFAITAAAFPF